MSGDESDDGHDEAYLKNGSAPDTSNLQSTQNEEALEIFASIQNPCYSQGIELQTLEQASNPTNQQFDQIKVVNNVYYEL